MSISSRTRSKFSTDSSEHTQQAEALSEHIQNSSLIMVSSTDADFEAKVNAEVAKVIAEMLANGTIAAPSASTAPPTLYD